MEEQPAEGSVPLQRWKTKLIDILSADPDYLLQHAHSCGLLTMRKYNSVKAMNDPSEKVCEVLDCVIQKGEASSREMLNVLRKKDMLKTFPKLRILRNLRQNPRGPKRSKTRNEECEENVPNKKPKREELVTDRQLMLLAKGVDHSWRQLGILALGLSNVLLDQEAVGSSPVTAGQLRDHIRQ
ncbi:uncharacterized protein zgc:174906 isoform X2 [Brienomyrus brachyistius]|uniref:uncharacterized protein zgc:174906 isoform X2 n=1 Tax=Brienomyrus brachyistius TaxID=42636 RepID=UPI0020B1C549|nr:uncharacterized protein zgc:174906 isoform X2 [Brienomyrus brachyistius]